MRATRDGEDFNFNAEIFHYYSCHVIFRDFLSSNALLNSKRSLEEIFHCQRARENLFIRFLCRFHFCHQIHADPPSYALAIFFLLSEINNYVGGKVRLGRDFMFSDTFCLSLKDVKA